MRSSLSHLHLDGAPKQLACLPPPPDSRRGRAAVAGAVPTDMPRDGAARGKVNCEDATGRFTLFADRCLIRNSRLVTRIMSRLSLPKNTKVLTDSHYRCPKCLGMKPTRKQEEEDWDF